jgi:hypothetical protein
MSYFDLLKIAMEALQRIAESDPGPAYHIARSALDTIHNEMKESDD